MASFNKVILLGNVTRDPELRYISNGTAVTDIGLAVNDRRKTATGEWVEETTFVDVTLWGRTAEIAGEYVTKGSPLLIDGRLKLDTWEKDGKKNSKLRVVCDRMQLLGSRSGGDGRSGDAPRGRGRPAAAGRGGAFNPAVLDGHRTEGIEPAKTNWAQKLDKPPYLCWPVTGGITFTFGGLKVNEQCQVVASDWKPMPGLYACGEMVGGLFHYNYALGSGLMSGVVFGRIAGRAAVATVGKAAGKAAGKAKSVKKATSAKSAKSPKSPKSIKTAKSVKPAKRAKAKKPVARKATAAKAKRR